MSLKILSGRGNRSTRVASIDLVSVLPDISFPLSSSTQHLFHTTCLIYIMSPKILSEWGNRLTRMASTDLVSFSRDISFPPPLYTQPLFHTTCLIDIARVKYIMGERQQCHAMDYQQSWFYFFPQCLFFVTPIYPTSIQHNMLDIYHESKNTIRAGKQVNENGEHGSGFSSP